jgi:thioredoxin-like negative regulator of GroEL
MSDTAHPLESVAAEKPDTIGHLTPPSSVEDPDGLSPAERRFIDLSASGEFAMEEIAAKLSVSSRTLRRWKARPAVSSQIRARVAEGMALARAVLAAGASRAARELVGLAETAEPDHARIAACVAIVSNATKLTEVDDLAAEIAEIRATLSALPANRFPRR